MSSWRHRRLAFYGVGIAAAALAGAAVISSAGSPVAVRGSGGDATGAFVAARAVVVRAKKGPLERTLDIQGETRPLAMVTLYAKVSGYLQDIFVDRGDEVQANQVLAVIQSPEIDRQHQAARVDAVNKRAAADSSSALSDRGAIAKRQVEAESASAQVAAAVLAGVRAQKEFAVLRAPFGGIVTARFADRGALVQNAANAHSGALPVVTFSDTSRLRVYAYVDQRNARLVKIGQGVEVSLPEAGVTLQAKVSRINRELDPRTRTMLVESEIDNTDGSILPGSFVRVRLTLKTPPLVEIPVEALVLRSQKTFVPVVGPGNRVTLRPVTVGMMEGALVSITWGVAEGEVVALNLGRGVSDGDLIDPVVIQPATPKVAGKNSLPHPDPAPPDAPPSVKLALPRGTQSCELLASRYLPQARVKIPPLRETTWIALARHVVGQHIVGSAS